MKLNSDGHCPLTNPYFKISHSLRSFEMTKPLRCNEALRSGQKSKNPQPVTVLRAYPNNPADLKAMRAQVK